MKADMSITGRSTCSNCIYRTLVQHSQHDEVSNSRRVTGVTDRCMFRLRRDFEHGDANKLVIQSFGASCLHYREGNPAVVDPLGESNFTTIADWKLQFDLSLEKSARSLIKMMADSPDPHVRAARLIIEQDAVNAKLIKPEFKPNRR